MRWRSRRALLVVAVALVGFAAIALSDVASTAAARCELAIFGGARLFLAVDIDQGEQQAEVLQQVRKAIENRLKNATGRPALVHVEGTRIFADLPRRAWARLLRAVGGTDGFDKLFVTAKVEFTSVDDEDASLARLSELPPGVTIEWDRYRGPNDAVVAAPYFKSKDSHALLAFVQDRAPPRRVLAVSLHPDTTGNYRTYLLHDRAALTGADIADARVSFSKGENRPYVSVAFSERGARSLEAFTANNRFRRMAIVFDGRVDSAPIITSTIPNGYCQIHPRDPTIAEALNEAKDLSLLLRSGALAAPVRLVAVETLPRRW